MKVLPARVRKPQDKAHMENRVKLAHKHFYTTLPEGKKVTLEDLNRHVQTQLGRFNIIGEQTLADEKLDRIVHDATT